MKVNEKKFQAIAFNSNLNNCLEIYFTINNHMHLNGHLLLNYLILQSIINYATITTVDESLSKSKLENRLRMKNIQFPLSDYFSYIIIIFFEFMTFMTHFNFLKNDISLDFHRLGSTINNFI